MTSIPNHTSPSHECAAIRCVGAACAVSVVLLVLGADPAAAQPRNEAYGMVGAGATDLNGGVQWHVSSLPVTLGAEIGVGWVFLTGVSATYHVLPSQPRTFDPFITAGYMGLSSSEFSANGVSIGGGVTYWLRERLGLRFDAFRFLPVSTENNIRPESRSPERYWGVRGGVAFRVW